jgi:hypothetical protein
MDDLCQLMQRQSSTDASGNTEPVDPSPVVRRSNVETERRSSLPATESNHVFVQLS